MIGETIYTVGGTVQAGQGIYIERQADAELLALCREGAFAYLLTARQMGKSSLMTETARRLNDEGIRTVLIDLRRRLPGPARASPARATGAAPASGTGGRRAGGRC